MRGYFARRWVASRLPARTLPTNPVGRFISAEATTRAASCVCAAPLTKVAPGSARRREKKLKLPLTSTLRQKQTQFESSSSNRGDVTSKLSRHRGHSLLPLREFDQQLGLLLGPFAGFCRPHCCARSEDRMLHQLRPRFGRDEGARSSPRGLARLLDDPSLPSSTARMSSAWPTGFGRIMFPLKPIFDRRST